MPTSVAFHFDPAQLQQLAETRADEYRNNQPFPHIVIDDFLPPAVLEDVLREFPSPQGMSWNTYDEPTERKLEGTAQHEMGDVTRHLFYEFNAAIFVEFLERLTGIDGLIPDPHLYGGGLHQIEPGGFLKVHADFNWYRRLLLDRRLNLLLYLNKDWQEEWGGHLELWDESMSRCEKKILPVFNRCVVFSTTSTSNHGHPEPLKCPPGQTRKSMALYYYSNGRPASESGGEHGTLFAPRPGEVWQRPTSDRRARLKRLVPPVVWDFAKRVADRREHSDGRT